MANLFKAFPRTCSLPVLAAEPLFGGRRLVAPATSNHVQVRTARVQIRKYREPHFDRKLMLAICEPVKAIDKRAAWEKCKKPTYLVENSVHPWEEIMAKELSQELNASRFVAVYHLNCVPGEEKLKTRNMLFKQGFLLKHNNRMVYKLAFEGTRFEALAPYFYAANNVLVLCKEPQVSQLLKLDKKMPGFLLLYGVVDNRILTKDQLRYYSELPSLDQMRAQLCHTLGSGAQALSRTVGQPSQTLSQYLETALKDSSDK